MATPYLELMVPTHSLQESQVGRMMPWFFRRWQEGGKNIWGASTTEWFYVLILG